MCVCAALVCFVFALNWLRGEFENMEQLIKDTVAEEQHGIKLHSALQEVLVEYLTKISPAKEEGDLPSDPTEWIFLGETAWGWARAVSRVP